MCAKSSRYVPGVASFSKGIRGHCGHLSGKRWETENNHGKIFSQIADGGIQCAGGWKTEWKGEGIKEYKWVVTEESQGWKARDRE